MVERDFSRRGVEGLRWSTAAEFAADGICSDVADDAAKPRPKLGWFAQIFESMPRRDKGFLGHIFGSAEGTAQAVGQGADKGLIPFDDFGEGFAVTFSRQAPELFVRGGG